ncbi:hypothetical protein GOB93_02940 [Acetobacter musti]|uniref:Uncharacterized protein n=1 Tax=Acetobacter musti TaxID=864732 RepID=A0ABX0JIV9_9PROT|nr:hypothetical protein [Acetobacter musti]NHN83596.1 hypothetical protein [Acetobacter musti]
MSTSSSTGMLQTMNTEADALPPETGDPARAARGVLIAVALGVAAWYPIISGVAVTLRHIRRGF